MIVVGESHLTRGAFVSTAYPGSPSGFRVKEAFALVIQKIDHSSVVERQLTNPHYLIITFCDGTKIGWIQGPKSWTRVD